MDTKKAWKKVRVGDVTITVGDPRMSPRSPVSSIQQARQRGYLVVEFQDGNRTSVNDMTDVIVRSV